VQRPTRRRASDWVADQIREEIVHGRRLAGDRLPPEQVLAAQLSVSRTAVREGLRVLELQGLVSVRHGYGGGLFVATPGPAALLGVLQTSLHIGQLAVTELYQARVLFEPKMARMAVEHDSTALAERLADNIAAAEEVLAEHGQLLGTNLQFHSLFAQAVGNRALSLVMQAFLQLLEELEQRYAPNRGVARAALRDHQQILEAVRAVDGNRVETLTVAHLLRLEGRFAQIEQRMQSERSSRVEMIPPWGRSPVGRREEGGPVANPKPQPEAATGTGP